MAKKKKKTKTKPKPKKINRRLRARNAALRLIAKEDGITFKEARIKFPRALIEVIWVRPARKVRNSFMEYPTLSGKYYKMKPGMPLKQKNRTGKPFSMKQLKKIRKMEIYWATVRMLSEEYGITLKQARAKYAKTVEDKGRKKGEEIILKEIGVWYERYDSVMSRRDIPEEDEDEDEEPDDLFIVRRGMRERYGSFY